MIIIKTLAQIIFSYHVSPNCLSLVETRYVRYGLATGWLWLKSITPLTTGPVAVMIFFKKK